MDVDAVVDAYWRCHALGSGSREERLAAESTFWAVEVVNDAAMDGHPSVLDLIDALLASPAADPCYVGAGPVEDLLSNHGARFGDEVADRCRLSPSWRVAVGCVWLDEDEQRRLPVLAPYLPARRPAGTPASRSGNDDSRAASVRARADRLPPPERG